MLRARLLKKAALNANYSKLPPSYHQMELLFINIGKRNLSSNLDAYLYT